MPRLPGGQVIRISNERARYHAARSQTPITLNTPPEQLLHLIDIIIEDDTPNRSSAGYGRYSGHTLADEAWFNQWDSRDRAYLQQWLAEPRQLETILEARKQAAHITSPLPHLEYDYPTRLYSKLLRHVQDLPLRAASPQHWLNTLLKLRNKGIRQEELNWSGIVSFLRMQHEQGQATLGKQQVCEQIDLSTLRLELINPLEAADEDTQAYEETARLMPYQVLFKTGLRVAPGDSAVLRYRHYRTRQFIGLLHRPHQGLEDAQQRRWFALDKAGRAIRAESGQGLFASAGEVFAMLAQQHNQSRAYCPPLRYSRQYAFATLHGGENYREWLLLLPDYQRSHYVAHYLERNVLLHIRTKERSDLQGRRLLFIEEVQSDWHQSIQRNSRGKRFQRSLPPAPFRNQWVELAAKLMLIHCLEQGLEGIAWTKGSDQEDRFQRKMPPVRRIYDQTLPAFFTHIGTPWRSKVHNTHIRTKQVWLRLERAGENWRVLDRHGEFVSRPRYDKQQAMQLMARHSKDTLLSVPVFIIPEPLKEKIHGQGLPLFGKT